MDLSLKGIKHGVARLIEGGHDETTLALQNTFHTLNCCFYLQANAVHYIVDPDTEVRIKSAHVLREDETHILGIVFWPRKKPIERILPRKNWVRQHVHGSVLMPPTMAHGYHSAGDVTSNEALKKAKASAASAQHETLPDAEKPRPRPRLWRHSTPKGCHRLYGMSARSGCPPSALALAPSPPAPRRSFPWAVAFLHIN